MDAGVRIFLMATSRNDIWNMPEYTFNVNRLLLRLKQASINSTTTLTMILSLSIRRGYCFLSQSCSGAQLVL